ncbi:MAG: tetratricopeptide repeat protein, partial [Deltaproteobacteria bacterium]|nr:tetratricopeptide repeat protein [Deltaproteobacteria bacterium]
ASSRERTLLVVHNLLVAGEGARACDVLLDLVERQWTRHGIALHADRDLDLITEHLPSAQAPRYWRLRARAAWARCAFDGAEEASKKALSLANVLALPAETAACESLLGEAHKGRGRYEEAGECFRAALEAYRDLGDRAGEAQCCLLLAQCALYMSRCSEAEGWIHETLVAAEASGKLEGVMAEAEWLLASVLQEQGRYHEARRRAEGALDLFTRCDNQLGVARAHWLLATLIGHQGDLERCREHHRQAEAFFKEAGDRWWILATALQGGWIAVACGEWQHALGVAEFIRGELPPSGVDNERTQTFLISAAAGLGRGDLALAVDALSQVDAIASHEPNLSQTRCVLRAWLAHRQGCKAEADTFLGEALGIFDEAGITSWGVPWILAQLQSLVWDTLAQSQGALAGHSRDHFFS